MFLTHKSVKIGGGGKKYLNVFDFIYRRSLIPTLTYLRTIRDKTIFEFELQTITVAKNCNSLNFYTSMDE